MDVPYTVLIAEDDLQWQKLLSHALDHTSDFKVICTASNGQDALHHIHRLHPQIILLDLVLPMFSGEAILRHIRSEMSDYRPHVFVVTNFGSSSMVRTIGNLDVAGYILRPTRLNTILDHIRSCLSAALPIQAMSTIPQDVLQELGLSPCRRYYMCTVQALQLCMRNPLLTEHITKELYHLAAERCQSTPSAVEHAIRNCHAAACRKNTPLYQRLFPNAGEKSPGNALFLTLLTQECLSRIPQQPPTTSYDIDISQRKLVIS